jgi:hypothetical protein
MKNPTFLLQAGGPLPTEKIACSFSCYPIRYCSLEELTKLDPQEAKTRYIPVGSVEFVKAYSDHVGIRLPDDFSYGICDGDLDKFLMRTIRRGTYGEATLTDFVKPIEIKLFTGGVKSSLESEELGFILNDTPVWVTEAVPFGAEFRFYVQDFIGGGKVQGWSRYDDSNMQCPEPDFGLVEAIMKELEDGGAPGAYTIDIGWRCDLGRYCLVELNDAWALGLYENNDPQSNPPTRQQYADMLVSRWRQIVFCSLLDGANGYHERLGWSHATTELYHATDDYGDDYGETAR